MIQVDDTADGHRAAVLALASLRPGARYVLAGAELVWQDEVSVAPTQAEFDAALLATQLAEAKADALRRAGAFAQSARETITGQSFDGITAAGWVAKAEAGRRYVAGTQSATDLEVAGIEATIRNKGETAEQLLAKWAAKDSIYRKAVAHVDGFLDLTRSTILACPTEAAIETALSTLQVAATTALEQFMSGLQS